MSEVLSEHTLMTVEELVEVLEPLDDLLEVPFEFGPGYGVSVEYSTSGGDPRVTLKIGEAEFQLAGESGDHLFKKAGLTSDLLNDYPPELTVPLLNYYLTETTGSAKALIHEGKVVALTKHTTALYSQVDILESIVRELRDRFPVDEVLVHNVAHDLNLTQYTLMFPSSLVQLDNGDVLMPGLFVQNSLLGKEPLKISGVVARDYHHNAHVSEELADQWDRRKDRVADLEDAAAGKSDVEDVYSWAASTAVRLYSLHPNEVNLVKSLEHKTAGNQSGTVLSHLLDRFSLPAKLRGLIHEHYVEEDGQSYLNIWNSITMAANDQEAEEKPKNVRKLMTAAGSFAHHHGHCKTCYQPTDDLD